MEAVCLDPETCQMEERFLPERHNQLHLLYSVSIIHSVGTTHKNRTNGDFTGPLFFSVLKESFWWGWGGGGAGSHLLSQVSIHLKKRTAPDSSYFSPRAQKCCWLNQICFSGGMSLTRFSLSTSLQYSQAGAMMGTMGERRWVKQTELRESFKTLVFMRCTCLLAFKKNNNNKNKIKKNKPVNTAVPLRV